MTLTILSILHNTHIGKTRVTPYILQAFVVGIAGLPLLMMVGILFENFSVDTVIFVYLAWLILFLVTIVRCFKFYEPYRLMLPILWEKELRKVKSNGQTRKMRIFSGPYDSDGSGMKPFIAINIFYGNKGSLSSFVDMMMQLETDGFEIISRSYFTTNKGLVGEKITGIEKYETDGIRHRYVTYYFKSKDRVATLECGGSVSWGDKYDDVFDDAIKTFEWK